MYKFTSTFQTTDGVKGSSSSLVGSIFAVSFDAGIVITGLEHTNIGAAFVFKRNKDGSYSQLGNKILPANPKGKNILYGYQIACNSDCSVFSVAAPGQDDYSGAVYIYKLQRDFVSFTGVLATSHVSQYFGGAIAMNVAGSYLLISAIQARNATIVTGFDHHKKAWNEVAEIFQPPTFDNHEDYYFGFSLDMNQAGDVSVIGGRDGAWIYKKSKTSWNLVTQLIPNDLSTFNGYGFVVVVMNDAGNVVTVTDFAAYPGRMWVFTYNGVDWVQDGSSIFAQDTSIISVGIRISMNSDGSIIVATANTAVRPFSGAFVVFQKKQGTSVTVPGCMPNPSAKITKCKKMIKICGEKHHIKMKWIQQSCSGVSGESGCQCDQFCGYSCQQGCNQDKECYWTNNQCYNKLTNLPGQSIQTCPVS